MLFYYTAFFICHDDLKSQTHHNVTSLTIAALLLPLLFYSRYFADLALFCNVDLVKK